jgi:hypothetical protein
VLSFDYVINSTSSTNRNFETKNYRKTKITQDFKTNYQSMQNENALSLMDMLLQLITSENWRNTTFICQDEDSLTQVSFRLTQIYFRCAIYFKNNHNLSYIPLFCNARNLYARKTK